ncbi:hypothetical protein [Shewanella sp. YIC-542]|uniref:hypothetical protein n=1 Tax=Shewanella mytili TaxID=3377111 RepID=UPI00398F0881
MRIMLLIIAFMSVPAIAAELDDVESLKKEIDVNLVLGASKQEVEAFLAKTSWGYTYDRFQNRFQAKPADGTAECKGRNFLLWLLYDCGIQIFINFDKSGSYSGYSVEQVYTGL